VHLTTRRHSQAGCPVLAGETERTEDHVRTILVVGGGYAGFYTAWKLEKKLRRGEAQLCITASEQSRPSTTAGPWWARVAGYD
jgi:cation diffusion facilitator CzcD-associated flavoprotein CzcO